jgi:hypothetical protein
MLDGAAAQLSVPELRYGSFGVAAQQARTPQAATPAVQRRCSAAEPARPLPSPCSAARPGQQHMRQGWFAALFTRLCQPPARPAITPAPTARQPTIHPVPPTNARAQCNCCSDSKLAVRFAELHAQCFPLQHALVSMGLRHVTWRGSAACSDELGKMVIAVGV